MTICFKRRLRGIDRAWADPVWPTRNANPKERVIATERTVAAVLRTGKEASNGTQVQLPLENGNLPTFFRVKGETDDQISVRHGRVK